MSRPRKNELTIEPVYAVDAHGQKSGALLTYRMFGYVNGTKIRRRDTDLPTLERERDSLLADLALNAQEQRPRNVLTFATDDQLKMLEGFLREFPRLPRPLGEYLRAGAAALGNGARVKISDAREAWEKKMSSVLVQVSEGTRTNNLQNLDHFVAFSSRAYLDEITAEDCRLFLERKIVGKRGRKQAKTQTRLTHGLRLQAFLNFCVKAGLLPKSPFNVDLEQMVKIARQERERARILTPEQAGALLDATIEICPRMIPHVLLSTWCFIREAEVARLEHADLYLDNKRPVVRLTGEKVGSKSARPVDIPANVLPLLRQCIETGLWPKGEAPFYSLSFFNTIREKAGLIKLGERGAGGYRKVLLTDHNWQAHIMRHTGISYHFNRGGDITDTTRQAGNCPETAFDHYISIPHEGDAERFYAIRRSIKNEIAHSDAHSVA